MYMYIYIMHIYNLPNCPSTCLSIHLYLYLDLNLYASILHLYMYMYLYIYTYTKIHLFIYTISTHTYCTVPFHQPEPLSAHQGTVVVVGEASSTERPGEGQTGTIPSIDHWGLFFHPK